MSVTFQSNSAKAELPIATQAAGPAKYHGKRKSILEAAHDVISEKGIENTTITQIAKRAGIVDSIIYHYFKNKEDVILSVLDLQLLNALEDLKFHFKGIMGPVSKLGKMIWYHLSMNDQTDTQMRKSMLLECRSYENFTTHESYQTLREYTGVMDAILERGIREGFFSPDLNIPMVRTMIFGFLDEQALMHASTEESVDTLSDFDQIMDLILAMTANPRPAASAVDGPDKYRRILAAAKHLYAEKGFNYATMAEVASLAGVAEGTIYEYFKNKQDLLLSITKEYFGNFKTYLDNSFLIDDPTEKLRWLMWRHFIIFAADRDLVTVFLKDTKLKKDFYKDEALEVFVRYHDKICEVLDGGKEAGVFRPEINTRVFRNFVMGALAGMYTRWYFRDPLYALDYMTELHHFIDLVCRTASVQCTK